MNMKTAQSRAIESQTTGIAGLVSLVLLLLEVGR